MERWCCVATTVAAVLTLAAVCSASGDAPRAEKYTALNPCISKQTCGECIRTASCGWCYQRDFESRPRCFLPTANNVNGGCDEAFVYNPSSLLSAIDDDPLTRGQWGKGAETGSAAVGGAAGGELDQAQGAAGGAKVVQVRPQKVELKLRMNEVKTLSVFYSQAEDYPLDLYYLMDLSKSMENDKESLSALGNQLAETMRKLTSNFRLGFGSFVDKTVMPYISTIKEKMESPCDGCARPYGFRNGMSLSTDTRLFSEAVRNANVSGNLDAPEGGFDALMQSIVCQAIGWRTNARKLIVFSTDAGFHYAGDGKLGGIIPPNDGECHLNFDAYDHYTEATKQDYPSISQINLKVKKHAINVIFAVTREQIGVYEQLQQHVEGSSSGMLSEDSSNVVDFVKEQYDKITSTVEMRDNSQGAVKITYYSSCLGDGPLKETNKCDGLKVGQVVEFRVEIALLECPTDPSKWNQRFQIYPVGMDEVLEVDLEMLCQCDCERPGSPHYEPSSRMCHFAGTYACGVCLCAQEHFGSHCECSPTQGSNTTATALCRPPDSDGPDCSGRGICICGQCECKKVAPPDEISGKYCECDNFSCDRKNSRLCSGEDHGSCVCGHCVCKAGWSGEDCSCSTRNDTCITPGNGLLCNGKGRCECGTCVCDERDPEHIYTGQYCTDCKTCTPKCDLFRECVLCQHFQQGLTPEECSQNCSYNIIPVDNFTRSTEDDQNSYICTYLDENDCRFSYKYELLHDDQSERDVYIEVQKKPDCPPPVFIIGVVLGVIAAIVLVGLALLMLWKMVTTIHDRREFARFEKERAMAKWDTGENPIYKQATSTFKNPTYQGK